MPGPFILDVLALGLGRRPGSMLPLERTFPSPVRIGVDLIAIPEGADVDMDLRLQSVSEGVLVTGAITADLEGQCSRCLEPVIGHTDTTITELFAYPDSKTEATTEEHEIHRVVDGMIDLEQTIVDAIVPDLSLAPLCRPDCPGLCPECGIALATAEAGHRHDLIDPRWAKLANFGDDQ
ncbi:MAG: YceD family protein [Mycobacterium sp.]